MKSGVIEIDYDTAAIATASPTQKGLRENVYGFIVLSVADWDDLIYEKLKKFGKKLNKFPKNKIIKLKDEIYRNLNPQRRDSGKYAFDQLHIDLNTNLEGLKIAISLVLRKRFKLLVNRKLIKIKCHQIGPDLFRIENNLNKITSLSIVEAYDVIQSAILAVGGVNKRIENMRAYNALSGLCAEDLAILNNKLDFLLRIESPEVLRKRFHRVVDIAGFPDFTKVLEEKKLSLRKLVKLRESSECLNFRRWLINTDNLKNSDIQEQLKGINARMSMLFHNNSIKTLRFLLTNVAGVINPVPGVVCGVINEYILDKILRKNDVAFFINKLYKSVIR